MKKEAIIIVTLIFLILLLIGCTEMTRSEKNLCVKLSSKSYAYIPTCETESSCFEKVSTLFKTKLGYEEESILYEIKNHVARSWYFYNLSLKEQKNIQNYCKSADSIKAAGAINQAQDLISDSFSELDRGIKKSFDLIALEEKKFSKEKIDLLKEEKIYLSLIELRQILSELNTGATNSDTYVSYYTKKAESFAKSSASKDFSLLIEKSPFWIDNFSLINDTILEELGIEKKGYFPFAEDLLDELINQAKTAFFKKQSILALQNFPIYEFMKLYSDLGGNNNSALKRFSDLINKTSENTLELKEKIKETWIKNEKSIIKLNELLQKENESKEFINLANKIMSKTITTDLNITNQAKEEIKKFIVLKETKYLSKLTLGEELNELKEIEINFNKIISSLAFKSEGFEDKLIEKCKEEATKSTYYDENKPQTKSILEEINYYSSRTKNTTGRECILNCQELIAKKELLEKTLENILYSESIKKDSLKECITYLEKIFANENLFELKLKFEKLKETEVTKENLINFTQNCESIKKQVENELTTENDFSNLLNEYKLLENNLQELEFITFTLNETEVLKLYENYVKEAALFNEYFQNEEIKFDKILAVKELILEKLITLNEKLRMSIKEKTIYFVEKNISTVKLNSEIIELNKSNLSKTRLIINNPFKEINAPVFLKINFDVNQITEKDDCVNSIINKTISLFYLPKGKTKIDFENETTLTLTKSDSFVYATNELSLIKREITLEPNINFQKVLVTTTQPENTINTVVLIDSAETLYANEENTTKFIIENLTSNTNIEIFYYLTNVIQVSKELIETKNTDLDETLIYKITVKNNFPIQLTANLFILFPSTSAEITVYSQDYTRKETKKIGDKIILSNQTFLEKETKTFQVWVKTSSALDYYKEGLEKQELFFIKHNYLEKADLTKKILESENLDAMKRLFESNLQEIANIELNEKNKTAFELLKQKLLEKIEELRLKQNELYKMGLISEAEKIGTTLDSIINEQLDSDKEIAKAFDKLITLSFSADNKLKSEVEKMWENINLKSENNNNLIQLKNNFFEKKQLFDEKFSFDAIEANKLFYELKEDYAFFLETLKEIDKNNSTKQKENFVKFNEDLNFCENTLNLIEKSLIENNSKLIKAKFIIPLTQSRIEKLRLLLNEIKNSSLNLEEKIKKLAPIKTEILESNEAIKKQAILAFNNAIDKSASKEVLTTGKKLIDETKYIEAYLVLYDNTSPTQTLIGFSVFLPILLIIIIAFIIKNKINKKEKENNEKKKVIMDEWEKL